MTKLIISIIEHLPKFIFNWLWNKNNTFRWFYHISKNEKNHEVLDVFFFFFFLILAFFIVLFFGLFTMDIPFEIPRKGKPFTQKNKEDWIRALSVLTVCTFVTFLAFFIFYFLEVTLDALKIKKNYILIPSGLGIAAIQYIHSLIKSFKRWYSINYDFERWASKLEARQNLHFQNYAYSTEYMVNFMNERYEEWAKEAELDKKKLEEWQAQREEDGTALRERIAEAEFKNTISDRTRIAGTTWDSFEEYSIISTNYFYIILFILIVFIITCFFFFYLQSKKN